MMKVEGRGGIVLGIDQQGKHSHFGPHRSNGRIGEQRATEFAAMECLVNRETADPGHGHQGVARSRRLVRASGSSVNGTPLAAKVQYPATLPVAASTAT